MSGAQVKLEASSTVTDADAKWLRDVEVGLRDSLNGVAFHTQQLTRARRKVACYSEMLQLLVGNRLERNVDVELKALGRALGDCDGGVHDGDQHAFVPRFQKNDDVNDVSGRGQPTGRTAVEVWSELVDRAAREAATGRVIPLGTKHNGMGVQSTKWRGLEWTTGGPE